MTILALDFGMKRIGVAVGSKTSGIAFPRDAIPNNDQALQLISEIVFQEGVGKILLGFPLMLDASHGRIVEQVRQFEDELKTRFHLPVVLVDERMSSKLASQKLSRSAIPVKKQKKLLDSVVAQILLEEFL